jgi:hypothetical protein
MEFDLNFTYFVQTDVCSGTKRVSSLYFVLSKFFNNYVDYHQSNENIIRFYQTVHWPLSLSVSILSH